MSTIPVPIYSLDALRQMGFNVNANALVAFSSSLSSHYEQFRPAIDKVSLTCQSYEAELNRISPEVIRKLEAGVGSFVKSVEPSLRTARKLRLCLTAHHIPGQAAITADSVVRSSANETTAEHQKRRHSLLETFRQREAERLSDGRITNIHIFKGASG